MAGKDIFFQKKRTINCRGSLLDLSKPLIMGILNVTPDSFYDGGHHFTEKEILRKSRQMISDGAAIIDAGAVSTRPGAKEISLSEEKRRLKMALEVIKTSFPEAVVSVDTYRSEIARWCVENYQVSIINDISGGTMDPEMHVTVAGLKVPYVLMHILGTPVTMQQNPEYDNVVQEVIENLAEKVSKLNGLGVADIIIDPGFGFGKTLEHNYKLLKKLDNFSVFNLPVLAGLSRKSMICKTLKVNPDKALTGTIALNMIALEKGADIIRVHDVREAADTIRVFNKYQSV